MKKGLIVLLVMVLAVGSVFAGISGEAELRASYNTKTKAYGFVDNSSISVDFDFATASAETVGEGPIVATAKGSLALKIADMEYSKSKNGAHVIYTNDSLDYTYLGLGIFPSLDELSVAGEGWKVSYNGSYQKFVDYASSPVDTYYAGVKDAFDNYTWNTKKAVSLGGAWAYKYFPGVVAEVAGYKVGFALEGKGEDCGFSLKAETPSLTVAEGVTLQGAVAASKAQTAEKAVYGIAAKAGYAKDALAVNVAGDVAIKDSAEFDVSLNAKYDFATVDVYYLSAATLDEVGINADYTLTELKGNKVYEDLFSAKAVVVLDQFVGLPLSVTVKGTDLLGKNSNQAITGEVTATVDAITAKVSGGYNLSKEKTTLSASVAYAADLYTASVGADLTLKENANQLVPAVSVTSDKLVSGATVGVKWAGNTHYTGATTATNDTNLLEGDDFGKIYAFVKVAF